MKDIPLNSKSTAEIHTLLIFNQTYWTLTSATSTRNSIFCSFILCPYYKNLKKKKKKEGILKFLNNFFNLFKKIIFFTLTLL